MVRLRPLIAILILGLVASNVVGAPSSADVFAPPAAPSNVRALMASEGLQITWNSGAEVTPAVTHYVVHAGQNSCPVIVPAIVRRAVMPIVPGQERIVPRVQAVNAYGFSSPTPSSTAINVRGKSQTRYASVQFLQFSDFHGAIEGTASNFGAARLATAFARDRREVKPTFTVSSGDNIGGAPVISSEFDEIPTIKALNEVRLDVSTLGNHEHDRPLPFLRERIDDSRFRYVVSNYSTLLPLQGKRNAVTPFTLIERDGVTVGFVGMNTPDVALLVNAGNLNFGVGGKRSIKVSDSVVPVQRRIDAAKRAGAQVVVVLAHVGWSENSGGRATGPLIDVAEQLTGAAVIYGGHTHQQYASVINRASVVEVENAGKEYSRTHVCLDTRTNRVLGSFVDFVPAAAIGSLPPNPRIAKLVTTYQRALNEKLDVRTGVVADVITNGDGSRSQQTAFGTLLSDAARETYGTDFAIVNIGGIRSDLPASSYQSADPTLRRPGSNPTGPYDVTLGDILTALPFGNFIATTTITGDQLWRALENGVAIYPGSGRLPQVSGLQFTVDPKAPIGSRVLSVRRPDGTPIARDASTYSLATLDYMVSGGDGYGNVFNPQQATIRDPLIDVLKRSLQADVDSGRPTVVPDPSNRLVIWNQ
jgi:2',3'-cyclic-nucleotide 2'-phosphodiesterase (5'-nucleotidase family)